MRLLSREDINIQKWDVLIDNAYNGNVYGYSWYLDIVAPDWKALVLGDYEYILPVPTNRKKIIEQVYHPLFNQTFDIYSLKKHDKAPLFFEFLEEEFKIVRLKVKTHFESKKWEKQKKVNMILPLDKSYDLIEKGYSRNIRRSLIKCEEAKLHENVYFTPGDLVDLFWKEVAPKLDNFNVGVKRTINDLIVACLRNGKGFILGVDHGKDNVVAAVFYINSHNRIVNFFGCSNKEGIEENAMTWLINKVIKDNSDTGKIFDFEGSNIPSIYNFFKKFGSQEENYYSYQKNSLPGIIKDFF